MAGILWTKDYQTFKIKNHLSEDLAEFQGATKAGKALPGDQVIWDPTSESCKLNYRNKHYPITGVLEITSKTKYGMTSRGVPIYLFIPCRKEYPPMVVGCSERNATTNLYCIVDFDSWDTTNLPRGNLRHILGSCADPQVEREALRLTFNPFKIPKKCKDLPHPFTELNTQRVPCPELTFNIDPEGCKDIDDVLSIYETETEFELWITISDVAECIEPASPIDEYASLQVATCYDNGKAVIPMLPYAYSEDWCSLIPGQMRYGVSLVLTYEKENYSRPKKVDWKVTTVCNKKQFTYENFISTAASENIPVHVLQIIASNLLGRETHDPHEWIEAFMLTYNLNAARLLKDTKRGVLRKHSSPDFTLLETYKQYNIKELEILANKSAEYCYANDTNTNHFGLCSDVYCHASSPIRRYADLLNQRVIKDILLGTSTSISPDIIWLNERQKDLKRYERDLFLLDKMSGEPRGSIEAIILNITGNKYKLWFSNWKRSMTWRPTFDLQVQLEAGKTILLSYYANPNIRHWKDKIVFHFEKVL